MFSIIQKAYWALSQETIEEEVKNKKINVKLMVN